MTTRVLGLCDSTVCPVCLQLAAIACVQCPSTMRGYSPDQPRAERLRALRRAVDEGRAVHASNPTTGGAA